MANEALEWAEHLLNNVGSLVHSGSGENLAWSWSSWDDDNSFWVTPLSTDSWYNEVSEGNYDFETHTGDGVTGHFT